MRLSGILVKSFVSAVAGVVLCFSSLAVSFAQEKDISDDEITIAVTRALVADQGIDANWVDVITQEGIVTLDGVVDDLLTRQRADKVAATVKGVRGVVNNITVEPVVKSDMRIEQDIENALAWNSATELWEVNVSSRNGAVTLTGKVDSWQERELAGIMARNITGVKEITNNITVEFDRTRSDHEIEQDVLKNLRWDRFVDASMVDVSVNDGIVSLSGTVGSAAEKNRVETLSWVSGVSSVRNDAVDVESWARDEEFRKDKFVQKSDTQVRQAVIDALRMDPRVNPDQVDVQADDGTVTLLGEVSALSAKRSAQETADNIVGVWFVRNYIKVRPVKMTDKDIEQRIKASLINDPVIESYEIDPVVNNGKVTLKGQVDNYYEKIQADQRVSEIRGVVSVKNNLIVKDSYDVLVADPYLEDMWYSYSYDWYTYPGFTATRKTDWQIKQDIQDEIWWSPFVDSSDVAVYVDDGVATLTGKVDTWSEWFAARDNAYEGGAVMVRNRLGLEYGPEEEAMD